MAAPTFVGSGRSAYDSDTSPKTVSVTVQAGDILVVSGVMESSGSSLATPTGGSLTYSLKTSSNESSYTQTYIWTATATGSATFDVSISSTGPAFWGFTVDQFRDSAGVGASSAASTFNASGAPSLAITTEGDSSAIVAAVGDWNATDGASRTWRTVNSITPTAGNGGERGYFRDSSRYTEYDAYWSDAGIAGAKTVGLSAPSGQKYAISAVEVLGSAGSYSASSSSSLTATISAAGVVGRSASSSLALSATISPDGGVTGIASATRSLSVAITAAGSVEGSPLNKSASLGLAVGVAVGYNFQADLPTPDGFAYAVAITATGSTGRRTSASLALSADITAASDDAPGAATADPTLSVAITAVGQMARFSASTMAVAVAITATGYKSSGAATRTRWVRVSGAWVVVPPLT